MQVLNKVLGSSHPSYLCSLSRESEGKFFTVSHPGPNLIRLLSRKYCLRNFFADKNRVGHQSQQCKLNEILAGNLLLLSSTLLCLQTLWKWPLVWCLSDKWELPLVLTCPSHLPLMSPRGASFYPLKTRLRPLTSSNPSPFLKAIFSRSS